MQTMAAVQTQRSPTKIDQGKDEDYYSTERLRRQYNDYLGAKVDETTEMRESRHYYHGDHWTSDELAKLRQRRQAPTTENMIVKKVNGVVGLIERLRQDPKAYPRQPKHDEGAELATATLRSVLDGNDWKSKSSRIAGAAAIDGIAGLEFDLVPGDEGDPSLDAHVVYGDSFFYDPRSFDEGFTDARYMGTAKWVDVEQAKELVPEKADEIDSLMETGSELTTVIDMDREKNWINVNEKKVRLIDHWYIKGGKWRWCLYSADTMLMQGVSPFIDEKGKSFSRYRMFSAAVDHDGDRYGFNRNLKSPQDQLNHFNSKKAHIANTRRVISEKGAVDDIEIARREWARPDGWIEKNPGMVVEPDQSALNDFKGLAEMATESRTYLENFGPNPSLIGQGLEDSSGRAIQLLQQAAIAELGPYLSAYKNWKIRVYRDIWNIIQRYWTSERWIRVTDDQNVAQFFQINKMQIDQFGRPAIVNAIGSLDVDIIIDEGPDAVNLQADAMMVMQSLGPQFLQQFPEIAIELSPLPNSVKKPMLDKIRQQQSQPPPPDPKLQALQAQAQMKAQEQQQNMALQQRQQQVDEQLAARQAQREDQKTQQTMALERFKTEEAIRLARETAAITANLDREKAHRQIALHREKSTAERQVKAQIPLPFDSATEAAVSALEKLSDHFGEMKDISREHLEVAKAPRSLVRDQAGRPVASVIQQ